MKICVLGGGNGAHTMAADLSLQGFDVTLCELPQFKKNIEKVIETKSIELMGAIEGTAELKGATTNIGEAIKDVDHLYIAVPAFAHKVFAELLAGKLKKEQVIVLFPGTFGSLEFKEIFRKKGKDIGNVIGETQTLPYDTRLIAPAKCRIIDRLPAKIAFIPANKSKEILENMRDVYKALHLKGTYSDVIEAGLNSANPAMHTGVCVINIGRIENRAIKGDFYLYGEVTPSATKLNKKLDEERKEIGKKFGYNITSLEDYWRGWLKPGWDWKDLLRVMRGDPAALDEAEPNSIWHRYFTEDAPYGIVTWSSIGKQIGVPTPMMDSVINIYNVIHEKNWWKEGRTVEKLGIAGMTLEEMKNYVKTGVKA
jgi:opine dehydrogenase